MFIEIWCAFSLVKGRNWARWIYLLDADYRCRLPVGGIAGLRVSGAVQHSGESKREIFHSLVMQKLPDLLLVLTAAVRAGELPSLFRLQ
ncbi:YbjO family protein [Klebsiella pneumoniae subsp. pneumoniae]|nr:YbjO family protein [Klebsiella pneumoniae subsp. pneumoniae]